MSDPKEVDQGAIDPIDREYEELLAAHEKRGERLEQKTKLHRIEGLKLIARFEEEIGEFKSKFAIVDLGDLQEGYVVVKLGEPALQKKLDHAIARQLHNNPGKPLDEMTLNQFVAPCVVHPSDVEFRALCGRRPAVLDRVGVVLARLFGQAKEDDSKKF